LGGSIFAFLGVIMAWYGVNFVLGAGLHSYGFGTGGYRYAGTFIAGELLFVAVMTQLWRLRIKAERSYERRA
jgi:hypothetical protein